MKKLNKKGFTLVELVIVIAVIAILSVVLIPTLTGVINNAKLATAKNACSSALTNLQAEVQGEGEAVVDGTIFAYEGYYFYFDANAEDDQLAQVTVTSHPTTDSAAFVITETSGEYADNQTTPVEYDLLTLENEVTGVDVYVPLS